MDLPAIALLAEDVSLGMGPDAARPLHYFRGLRARDVDVHLVTRDHHRAELEREFPDETDRVHCVPDPKSALWLARLALLVPERLRPPLEDGVVLIRQRARRRVVSQLVRGNGVRVVHQVTPARPGVPSLIHGLGVPIVMGPMVERTDLPPGFREEPPPLRQATTWLARASRACVHRLLPGRRQADVLLVSNARSSRAVPAGARGRKVRLGADAMLLDAWKPRSEPPSRRVPLFVYAGPLGPDSGADMLIEAFRLALDEAPARLRIAGEGPLRARIERRITELDLEDHITCEGWIDTEARHQVLSRADAVVYPGLRDSGAELVMQAMSLGIPVVATDWGAPSEYAGEGAALLVGPRTRRQLIAEFATAMHRLATQPELRHTLGSRAAGHAHQAFGWRHRVDRLLDVYALLAGRTRNLG